MKSKLLVQLFLITVTGAAMAQPSIQWQKPFGGSAVDEAFSIALTKDDGYIMAGYAVSNDSDVSGNHGGTDFLVAKFRSDGTVAWQKLLGGTLNENAKCVQQTFEGGYIVAGGSFSNNGQVSGHHGDSLKADGWVVKLDSAGTIEWQQSYGGTGTDWIDHIEQTHDSGYIFAAYTLSNDGDVSGNHGSYDFWIVKLSSAGVVEWKRCLGSSGADEARCIRQTADSGYIVAGYATENDGDVTGNHGSLDYWVVKLGKTGNTIWQKCFGGSDFDIAQSIEQTTDGGFIMSGYCPSTDGDVTGNHGGSGDIWVVKITHTGLIEWQKSLGGSGHEEGNSVHQTSDGGYVVAGHSSEADGDVTFNAGGQDCWVVKLNSAGSKQWQKSFGGTQYDVLTSVQEIPGGGYIVAGTAASNDGDVSGNNGGYDCWVVQLSPFVGMEDVALPGSGLYIYPNPVSGLLAFNVEGISANESVTVSVLNVFGQQALSFSIADGAGRGELPVAELTAGIYFLKVHTSSATVVKKFVKQ